MTLLQSLVSFLSSDKLRKGRYFKICLHCCDTLLAPLLHFSGLCCKNLEWYLSKKRSNGKRKHYPRWHQLVRSTPDSLPDSSGFSDEYRSLRRKYLLLEEESFSLGKELGDVEAEVKTLEDEKFALLDQLVVLEGLIDPSELQPNKAGL
ncbi:hypothetical protein J5N97_028410 [Dioscorea zingiberensis]|uniref:Uncharacterized protein n=1 Tax=Dioscorea zingiberensis TaxID=325984 RepID=A0A9D5H4S9_9LILI|nr:hypothetical protein J5N97_028410 [Dioscorea zingiberensis]